MGAIGIAVGLGAYDTAIVLSIVTFATLRVMTNFKSSKNSSTQGRATIRTTDYLQPKWAEQAWLYSRRTAASNEDI